MTAILAALSLAAAATTAPLPAGADQLANERAEASFLAAKIATLGQEEDTLSEQYDEDSTVLAMANARVVAAFHALAAAQAAQTKAISLLQQDAIEAYIGGGPQMVASGPLPTGDLSDALVRQELAATFAAQQADDLDSYRLAADNITVAKAQLTAARNADARQVARLERDRNQVIGAQDQLISLQQQVKGKIAVLVAQIEQAQMLAEQRAEQARLAQERAAELAAQAAAERAQAEAQAAAAAQARQ
ncbi:MAG TPA: hypothetical protein VEJ84_18735, partial [Acidimicrobiales bacterium]|nr:hypothetical protein [Acidimicrobiales bacterium]